LFILLCNSENVSANTWSVNKEKVPSEEAVARDLLSQPGEGFIMGPSTNNVHTAAIPE
jgi:hypothetical protein